MAHNQQLADAIGRINISEDASRLQKIGQLERLMQRCDADGLKADGSQNNLFIANATQMYADFCGAALVPPQAIDVNGPPTLADVFQKARHTLFLLKQAEEIKKMSYATLTREQGAFVNAIQGMDLALPLPQLLASKLKQFTPAHCGPQQLQQLKDYARLKNAEILRARNEENDRKKQQVPNLIQNSLRKTVAIRHQSDDLIHRIDTVIQSLGDRQRDAEQNQTASKTAAQANKKDQALQDRYQKDTAILESIKHAKTQAHTMKGRLEHRVTNAQSKMTEWQNELGVCRQRVDNPAYDVAANIETDYKKVQTHQLHIDELEKDVQRVQGVVTSCEQIAANPETHYPLMQHKANFLIKVNALSDINDNFIEEVVRKQKVDEAVSHHGLEGQTVYRGVHLEKHDVIRVRSQDNKICIEQDHKGRVVDRGGVDGKTPFNSQELSAEQKEKSALAMAKLLLRSYKPGDEITLKGSSKDAMQASMVYAALLMLTQPEPNNIDYIKVDRSCIKLNVPGAKKPGLLQSEEAFITQQLPRLMAQPGTHKEDMTKAYRLRFNELNPGNKEADIQVGQELKPPQP